jgi:hypothetical protein
VEDGIEGVTEGDIASSPRPHHHDGALNKAVRMKIRHYRQIYADRPDPIVLLTVAVSSSGHVYEDFTRMLFLHTHREASILAENYLRNLSSFVSYELHALLILKAL